MHNHAIYIEPSSILIASTSFALSRSASNNIFLSNKFMQFYIHSIYIRTYCMPLFFTLISFEILVYINFWVLDP